jgi:ribonuclease-3
MGPPSVGVERLEEALGHRFANSELLAQALTHRSYLYEHPDAGELNNERLEFLGDAIFHFAVADELFVRFPTAAEGELTALRAALVCTPSLAAIAEDLDLDRFIRASRGEATLEGRGRQSILADALEAVVAAVYRDAGTTVVQELVRRLIVPRIEGAAARQVLANAKGRLQERVQATEGVTPFYRVVERSGPVHAEHFVVEAIAGERVLGRGEGLGKRQAEQEAAKQALAALDVQTPLVTAGESAAAQEVAAAAPGRPEGTAVAHERPA